MAAKKRGPTGRPRGRPRKYPKVEPKAEPTAEPKVEPQKEGGKKLILKLKIKAKNKDHGASSSTPAPPVTPPPRDIPSDVTSDGSVDEILKAAPVQIEGHSCTGTLPGFANAYNDDGNGSLKVLSNAVNAHQEGFRNDCTNNFPESITTETLPSYHYFLSFGYTDVTAPTEYDSEATISARATPEYDDRKTGIDKSPAKPECKTQAKASIDTTSESVYGNDNSSIGCDKVECDSEATVSVRDISEDGDCKHSGDKVILTADFFQIQRAAQTGFYDWLDPALRDPYSCDFCVATFDVENSKKRHELVNHTGIYYQCPGCAMTFLEYWSLQIHAFGDHLMDLLHQAPVQRVQHDPEMQQLQVSQYMEAERIEDALRRSYEADIIARHRQRVEWRR